MNGVDDMIWKCAVSGWTVQLLDQGKRQKIHQQFTVHKLGNLIIPKGQTGGKKRCHLFGNGGSGRKRKCGYFIRIELLVVIRSIHWNFEPEKIRFVDENGNDFAPRYAYDPRLVEIEGVYYIIWCTDFYGASIGMAKTTDFKKFVRIENPFIPFNRNAVLFPRKIHGNFHLLSRPSDSGHTPFGDIFVSESPDMTFWGKHRHVMGRSSQWWQSVKIGGGAAPIETSEGWLLFYHGVTGTCNGFVYSMGGAILDMDEPSKVLYRCENYLLTPETWYEERGFVPNVIFPCATLSDTETGRIAIYYGAADSYVGLAFTTVDRVVSYIKEHSSVTEDDTDLGIR